MACKEMVFHFNKKFLEDPSIPMWVIKAKGKTMYVNHVECNVPWTTKETADNNHTKGSIKVKDCLLQIDCLNEAKILPLTLIDKVRLKNIELGITRIIFSGNFDKIIKEEKLKHTPFKTIHGDCGSRWVVCDLLDQQQLTWISLKYDTKKLFRVLQPNESYYRAYDDPEIWKKLEANDGYDEDDEDEILD
jgi:hypothetical protein